MEWFKGMKHGKECGVVYVGLENSKVPIEDRMLAMTGAFLRNYVNAKFMVVQDVLLQLKKGEMPECTVLLIPNFCLSKGDGGHIASWEVSSLLGLLYSRLGKGLKTVLYVSSMESLVAQYGKPFKSHIDSHYVIVQ